MSELTPLSSIGFRHLPLPGNVNNDNKSNLNNVSNDIEYIPNNDINVDPNKKKKYALDRSKFVPNDEKSQLAEKMASEMDDLNNFAYYYSVVKKAGISEAMRILRVIQNNIKEKMDTNTPVRNKGRYFVYMVKNKFY